MKPLDIRDIAIIDALPVYRTKKTILNVGCGKGRIDWHLTKMGYRVYATDKNKDKTWKNNHLLTFQKADIFDLTSFPIPSAPIVICSQVLEHLINYKQALKNLLILTETRLIITFPYKHSFNSPDHIHFWDDSSINEFKKLALPFSISISKIITKKKDIKKGAFNYLITIDKRQRIG